MKRHVMIGWLVVLCATTLLCAAKKKELTLEELKDRAEKAKPQDQPHLYIDVADRQLETATTTFDSGDSTAAQSAVADVGIYGKKAAEAALQSRKKLKNTENSLREIVVKLRDLKRSVSFEDRQPIQTAIDDLEKMRTRLLTKMFSKD